MFKVFFFELSKEFVVFVGLIIMNCIVMGWVEGYVMSYNVKDSFIDGLGNGLGYSLILIVVVFFCELFGFGKLFGLILMKLVNEEGWYEFNGMMLFFLSVFFIIGFFIWVL